MLRTDCLESTIRQELGRIGPCSLEELNERLPYYSWNQVFAAVDRLNREGLVTLQRSDSFDYTLSLASNQPFETQERIPS